MKRIYKVHEIVKEVLKENEEARDDDFVLICEVYYKICPLITKYTFSEVMLAHNELNLPSFETIRRTRQKIQETHKDLIASKKVKEARMNKMMEYRDYALGKM